MTREPTAGARNVVRDGLTVGALGAAGLALWMVGTDAASGHPFATPRLLGAALAPATVASAVVPAALYFILHTLLLIALGVGFTALVHRADAAPPVLVVAALLLPLVLFLYTGLVAVLAQSRLGAMAWVQFGAGGVLTTLVMAWVVYRRHPAVRADLARGFAEDG
jgi:hypothetical protein